MFSILYVDDERDLLELAKLFLEQSPEFHIEIALSAREALASPHILSCDAIISDYQMPEMDGIAFLKTVRERFGNIPFILFTGRGREEVVIEAINNGVDFYLQKGGDVRSQFAELAHKIRQVVARRQAERSLIESEKRLADIINFLPDATLAINREGVIIAWNRAIEEMTGISAEMMLGKGNYEYALPFYGERRPILIDLIFEPDEVIKQKYSHIVRKKDVLLADTTLPRLQGREVALFGKASPLYNSKGEIVGAIEAIRDISERQKSDDELRLAYEHITASEEELRGQLDMLAESEQRAKENETKYRDLFDNSVTGIFRTTIEGKFLAINTTFARIAGYGTPQEMMEAIQDIRSQLYVNPDDRDLFMNTLKREGKVRDFQARFFNRQGHTLWININAIAVRGADGNVQYYEGTIEDITDQKKVKEALLREKTFTDAVIDSVPGLLYLYDPEGRLVRWNKAHESLTGYSAEELARMHFLDWYKGDEEAIRAISGGVERAFRDGQATAEACLQTKNGKKIPFFFTAQRLEVGGKTYFTGVGIDITDRKKAEDELRAAYEQISASEEKLREQLDVLAENEKKTRESEEKFRVVFERSHDALMLSEGIRLIDCNSRAFELFGYRSLEEMAALHPADASPNVQPDGQDSWSAAQAHLKAVSEKGEERFEWVHQRKDGSTFPAEVFLSSFELGGKTFIQTSIRDITDRKLAEDALRESEEKYRLLADTSPEMIYFIDTNGYVRYVNQAASRQFHAAPDDLIGKQLSSIFPPTIAQRHLEAIRKVTVERQMLHREIHEEFPTGSVDIDVRLVPVINNKNQIIGVLGLSNDITDRKRAEDAHRESEAKYRRITDNARDMVYRMAIPSGQYEYVSTASVAMIGYTPEELYADPGIVRNSIHPDWKEYFTQQWSEMLVGRVPPEYEYQIIDRSGIMHWFNQRNVLVRDENGKPVALEGIVTDITDRKQVEAALRESEQHYRSVIENIQDAVVQSDREGRLVMASPSAARLIGYESPDEILGMPMTSFYKNPDDRQAMLNEMTRTGKLVDYIFEIRRRDGSTLWGSLNAHFLYDKNGQIKGTEGAIHDITERRLMEQAIREANHKLNLLNSITRHDVANQLTILQGFAQIAAMKKGDPVITDYLTKILAAADTIARQIEFTRTYQELGVRAPLWVLIEGVIGHIGSRVPVRFSRTCGGIEIYADPMLERVFFNLVDNAIRHGGRVTEITVRCEREPDSLLVIVEDNGNGIPVAEKEKIFRRGYGKNSGLGLFLVQEILAITGITIRETGIPGTGARFEMLVPKGSYRFVKPRSPDTRSDPAMQG